MLPHSIHSSGLVPNTRTVQFYLVLNKFEKTNSVLCCLWAGTKWVLCICVEEAKKWQEYGVLEMEVSDDDFDYGDNEDEDDDDDEAMVIPLENMKKWLENKPTGFGEGKAYDTSIEDKLFEEMEQSKEAQLANINKLKRNPVQPNSKETHQKRQKAPEVIYSGIRVRLSNLPKKKNIHKNLQLAFKGVPGIINIVPAVSGNEKTRDLVCKGFAFVYLRSEQDANRFVQMFSSQSISFGKTQKQIKCEVTKPHTASSDSEELAGKTRVYTKKILPVLGKKSAAADFPITTSSLNISDETVSNDSDVLKDELITAEWEGTIENPESPSTSELISDDIMEPKVKSVIESSSSNSRQQKKIRSVEKKLVDKRKGGKVPKLTIPGSANRLKMKEKAVLTGVLSKYAENAASASREEEWREFEEINFVMNCLFQSSSYTVAAIFSKTSRFVARNCLYGCSTSSWKRSFEYAGIKTSCNLEFALTRFRVQCYSSGESSGVKSRSRKSKAKPVMEEEKGEFFVVRKGDVVGVYKSFSDCQAQVGSSVCDPSVSVYKGYSMPKDTEEYLLSRGLKNAIYTIRAADLKDDLFGSLVPCPIQLPDSTIGKASGEDVPKKRSLEEVGTGIVGAVGSTTNSTDPLKKHLKLDGSVEAQVPSSDHRTCILEFDGASKGNPGPAGAGAVLRHDNGNVICRLREGLGIATNNAAEYRGMILGLRHALEKGYTGVRVKGDSKLVCMQIQGLWRAKAKNMSDLYKEAKKLKKKFHLFEISHVLRAFNPEADAQANLAVSLADGQVQVEVENEGI